ncbi:K(+)/H(+) antiporter [Entophlyctis sp. JEL0112]|nr:K(+)/H(+) antiporter [Entophlyctis sp. JEL0112]
MVASGTILTGSDPLTISALSLFLLQAIIVIGTARVLAIGLRFLRQPQVIAEVLSGIVLGGSALSRIEGFKNGIFPDSSMAGFSLVADFGLVLYLFLIGLEMDPSSLVKTVGKAVPIAIAGITLPFVVGIAVSKILYDTYASPTVPFSSFLIFTGVAMSITAFPVLARILAERKLLHSRVGVEPSATAAPVGQATLSAGVINDVVAWILLVLVIALINQANYATAAYVFLTVAAYAIFLWVVVRRLLLRLVVYSVGREHVGQWLLFAVFVLVLFSGWFTEIIGVQAIFGSFLVGVIMPHEHGFARKLASQIEDLITIVFLPLFFAYSGINTRLDLLNDGKSWGFVLLIIFVACAGKIIGCTFAAKLSGFNWRESFAVGTLMNTKGLVELIVLNLGLNAGAITAEIFTMFVVMAVITTLMTVPIVSYIYPETFYVNEVFDKDADVASSDEENSTCFGDNVRALVYLPSIKVVPSIMTLSSLLSSGDDTFTIHALRLVHLGQRMSTLIQASENEDSKHDEDPILHVFRTFASLHHMRAHTLLSLGHVSSTASTIIEAATHVSATLVVIPQQLSKLATQGVREEEQLLETMSEIVNPVTAALPHTTVVYFLDRQYGSIPKRLRSETPATDSFLSASEVPPAATEGKPFFHNASLVPSNAFKRKVTVILGGTLETELEDLHTLKFAAQLLKSSVIDSETSNTQGRPAPPIDMTFVLLSGASQTTEDTVAAMMAPSTPAPLPGSTVVAAGIATPAVTLSRRFSNAPMPTSAIVIEPVAGETRKVSAPPSASIDPVSVPPPRKAPTPQLTTSNMLDVTSPSNLAIPGASPVAGDDTEAVPPSVTPTRKMSTIATLTANMLETLAVKNSTTAVASTPSIRMQAKLDLIKIADQVSAAARGGVKENGGQTEWDRFFVAVGKSGASSTGGLVVLSAKTAEISTAHGLGGITLRNWLLTEIEASVAVVYGGN